MLSNVFTRIHWPQLALLTGVMGINYILYCTKDTLMVHHIGPESIVFLRTFLVLPFVFLFFLICNQLSTRFGMKLFFIGFVGTFIAFQLIFSFFQYPVIERRLALLPNNSLELLPVRQLLELWPLTFYYLLCEIWVVFVLGVITWQAINSINTLESAKKNYHSLQFFSNFIILLTSQVILLVNYTNGDQWSTSLQVKSLLMLPLGAAIIISILKLLPSDGFKTKAKRKTLSLLATIKMIGNDSKGRALFFMILFYSFCNTFSETINRACIKSFSSDIVSYNNVMAVQSLIISVLTIGFILLGSLLNRYNLPFLSLALTPFFVLTSTLFSFLLFTCFPDSLFLLMMVSVLQVSIIKSSKYGLIDPAKEYCYLELSEDMKSQGKSFIDGVSNRSGKTLGNILQQLFFITLGGINLSLTPFLVTIGTVSIFWLLNTKSLQTQVHSMSKNVFKPEF